MSGSEMFSDEGMAVELTNDEAFRRVCENAGGEWGKYIVSPGGSHEMSCKFGDDVVSFHRGDPMTGEGGTHMQVDTDSGNIITQEVEGYQVNHGPSRLDVFAERRAGGASSTFGSY